jgi:hypothetical protein
MRTLGYAVIGLLAVGACVWGWRAVRQIAPRSAQASAAQSANPQPRNSSSQAASNAAPAGASANHLGPFSIAGRKYTVELQTRKVGPGSTGFQGDTVVGMEIRDAAGAVQYRKEFPYVEATGDLIDTWSVSALLLSGTNGTGLLVSYDTYSEPSAPEQEPTGWFQVFGVRNGKLAPFGAPMEVQGGLLDQNSGSHSYKAARPLGTQADEVEFKVWAGHCRLIFPVRVDWSQGKLTPAQECAKTAGGLSAGCQYKVVPEDHLSSSSEITFVRLWPNPDEKSGKAQKTVVKRDSQVELLTAQVATEWVASSAADAAADSKGPLDDAGRFGVAADAELWLKVRIDGKEGWMHSEEDFQALGLPEEE